MLWIGAGAPFVNGKLVERSEDQQTVTPPSQADLYRAEGAVATSAALLLVVRPRRYAAAIAALVAGSALLLVLVYRCNDIGKLGPIPSTYKPVRYTKKTASAFAEAAPALAAVLLVFALPGRSAPSVDHARGQADSPKA